jgi:glucosamine--fructose-6-phosphate aminotransferase (isomerizing)
MCGIVGYVGPQQATPILLEGLARLEYRGYDSAGIAILGADGTITVQKRAGKLSNLAGALGEHTLAGAQGIAHTRWATHGQPNDTNAHPHQDCQGDIALVHNGIIENYQELRDELRAQGHTFTSETDTEVLAHLIERETAGGAKLADAVFRILPRLRGAYALVIMSRREPGVLVGARSNIPLIAGLGEGENYFASDITALLRYTRRMVTLHDGEMAVVTAENLRIVAPDGSEVQRDAIMVDWDAEAAEKGGYPHYLLKEMLEQPDAAQRALLGRIGAEPDGGMVARLPEFEAWAATGALSTISRVVVLACGTSYYASLIGRAMIERWARLTVEPWIASEFRYADPVIGPDCLVIAVTQSGETADTIAAIKLAKAAGAPVIGITNTVGSALTREVDATLFMQAGPEISVASTKTFAASVIVLTLLALSLAQARATLPAERVTALLGELETLPVHMEKILSIADEPANQIQQVAQWLARCRSTMFIGRGAGYAVAGEGALKLKELSYVHAEAYPAGELKHGPITLLDQATPLVAIATQSHTYEKVISNIQEVRARHARVIAIATAGDRLIREHAEDVFFVPALDELLMPTLSVIPLQLLAYYTAVERGCDIDQPRNLAKSVTVE